MDWTPPPPLACSLTPIHAPTPLLDVLIRDRIIFRKAARNGLCVGESKEHDQAAEAELHALYREVFGDG